VALSALSLSPLLENWRLLGKSLLLLVLLGLLTVVHINIQPRIDKLLSQVTEDSIPPEIVKQVTALRLRRKRLAATCLFVLLTILILAVQAFAAFSTALTVVLVVLAALLSWRVYKVGVPYGWV
jgi:p-aminobenzoyl-glutamate transporter AbgT